MLISYIVYQISHILDKISYRIYKITDISILYKISDILFNFPTQISYKIYKISYLLDKISYMMYKI